MGLKEDIAAINDLVVWDATPDEWADNGLKVYVRTCSAAEREELEARFADAEETGTRGVRGWFLARVLCDAEGRLVYDDPAEGERVLAGKNASAVHQMFLTAQRLNRIDADSLDDEKKD